MRKYDNLGKRREGRVAYCRPGYVLRKPSDVSFECLVVDISVHGIRLDVGQLKLPEIFGVYLTAGGRVGRVCKRVWRHGSLIGARFLTAKELREQEAASSDNLAAADKGIADLTLV